MLRNRALVRSAALAAIATAASFSLVATAGAETSAVAAVALVGRNAPHVEAGAVLDGAARDVAVDVTVIPEIERTDGSGRTSYAFTDAAGVPVAPPVEAIPVHLAADLAVSFLPAAEVPAPADPSPVSTIVLLAGLALTILGTIGMASGTRARLGTVLLGARVPVTA